MKGYKAFDKDLKCRNFQFEVGKTYKHDGEIELCESGFHFCKKCADCFKYYDFDKNTRICEIEASGNIKESDDDSKCVTSVIKIIRELSWDEVLNICNSGYWNSGYWNSGNWNSGNCNSGNCNSGNCNSGNCNSGYRNSGYRNSGNCNSGNCNSGYWNSGNWNSGNCNSGNCNSGNCNSGNCNSGNRNSGYRNSGNCNSGNCNSGNCNSGNWNSGNCNSGYLNTDIPPIRIFDKETSVTRDNLSFPKFFFFDINVWIDAKDMTEEEQKKHPSWQVTGGYLKVYNYKEAWRQSFEKAKASYNWESEKKKLLALPNFDFQKFEIISGISEKDIME